MRRKFRNFFEGRLERVRYVTFGVPIGGVILLLAMPDYVSVLGPILLLLCLLALVIRSRFWVCPHCKQFLGRRWGYPAYCPSCGKKIKPPPSWFKKDDSDS